MRHLLRSFFLMLLPLCARSQQYEGNFQPPDTPLVVRAMKVEGKINLDGILDEPDWQNAPLISDFFRIEPKQGGPYDFKTEMRVLFDDKNLYVGGGVRRLAGKKRHAGTGFPARFQLR